MSQETTAPRSRRARFLSFWSPRIGEDAAKLRWAWANSLNLAYGLNLVSLPCIFIGAWAHIAILVPIGVAIYVGQGALIVLAVLRLKASNRAASRALGIKIGTRGITAPPRPAGAYEAWCEKHGIRPYGAARDLRDQGDGLKAT